MIRFNATIIPLGTNTSVMEPSFSVTVRVCSIVTPLKTSENEPKKCGGIQVKTNDVRDIHRYIRNEYIG